MSSSDGLNILYSVLTVLGSVGAVVLCIAVGWFLIWKLFLSRFEFIKEIVNSGPEEKPRRARSSGQEQLPLRRSSRYTSLLTGTYVEVQTCTCSQH